MCTDRIKLDSLRAAALAMYSIYIGLIKNKGFFELGAHEAYQSIVYKKERKNSRDERFVRM